jgi:hypothetical protein
MRGLIVRAADCSLPSSALGTITSASTLTAGRLSRSAAATRHPFDLRSGFSSVTTSAGPTSAHSRASAPKWTRTAAGTKHEADSHPLQPASRILQPLRHEDVVPQVRDRMAREQAEKYQHGFAEFVGGADGDGKRGIVDRPLRPLHPIEHATAARVRIARPPDRDPWIGGELSDGENDRRSPWPRSRSPACRWVCAEIRWGRERSHAVPALP